MSHAGHILLTKTHSTGGGPCPGPPDGSPGSQEVLGKVLNGNKRSAERLAGASGAGGFLLTPLRRPRPRPPPATPTRSCRRQRFPAALPGLPGPG